MEPELEVQNERAVAVNAGDFFSALDRLRQGQRMFDEGHENVARLKESAVESFNSLFDNSPTVRIRITPFDFYVGEESIYHEGDPLVSLAYRFHQDGVKEFVFHEGISEQEFLKFVEVCAADFNSPEYEGYDTASLMWEFEFQNIAYVAVESFAGYEDDSEEESSEIGGSDMQIVSSVDEFISKILGDLAAGEQLKIDIRISAEDLKLLEQENKLEDVDVDDAAEEDAIDVEIPASARQQLLESVEREANQLNRRKLYILVELMQRTTDPELYGGFLERFRATLHTQIQDGDFDLVSDVLGGASDFTNEALQRPLGKELAAVLCHPQAYDLFRTIAEGKDKHAAQQMAKLLAMMPSDGLRELIPRFAEIESTKLSINWVGWVLRHPKFNPVEAAAQMHALDPSFAVSVISAVGEKSSVTAMRSLVMFLEHEQAPVRLAALDATSKSNIPEAKIGRRKCLDDPEERIRSRALRYVQHMRDSNSVSWLKEKLDDEAFLEQDWNEAAKYLVAYAVIEQKNALPLLKSLLDREGGRLRGRKADKYHQLAVQGLEVIVANESAKVLVGVIKSNRYSKGVRAAAEKAAHSIKDRLTRKGSSS